MPPSSPPEHGQWDEVTRARGVPESNTPIRVVRTRAEALALGWTAFADDDFSTTMLVQIGQGPVPSTAYAPPLREMWPVDFLEILFHEYRFTACYGVEEAVRRLRVPWWSEAHGALSFTVRGVPAAPGYIVPRSMRAVVGRQVWLDMPCDALERVGAAPGRPWPAAIEATGVTLDETTVPYAAYWPKPTPSAPPLPDDEQLVMTWDIRPENLGSSGFVWADVVRADASSLRERDVLFLPDVPFATTLCMQREVPCTLDAAVEPSLSCLEYVVSGEARTAGPAPLVRTLAPPPPSVLWRVPQSGREIVVHRVDTYEVDPECDPTEVQVYRSAEEAAVLGPGPSDDVDFSTEMLVHIGNRPVPPLTAHPPPLPLITSGSSTVLPIAVLTRITETGPHCCDIPAPPPDRVVSSWDSIPMLYRVPRSDGPVQVRWVGEVLFEPWTGPDVRSYEEREPMVPPLPEEP